MESQPLGNARRPFPLYCGRNLMKSDSDRISEELSGSACVKTPSLSMPALATAFRVLSLRPSYRIRKSKQTSQFSPNKDSFEKITEKSKLHSFCMYIMRIKAKHSGKITTFFQLTFCRFLLQALSVPGCSLDKHKHSDWNITCHT